ncbi:myosin-6-like [Argentina anserina]|uniref:myosin-6-like n=1 Tax=Argentina anserina TaxID=57926 RepID=UPI00217683E9|nr:myosin-6-like [Potentilla anserina]
MTCEGKPVAAFTIYKCLLQCKSFEPGRTSVFDRLIQMIDSEIEKSLKARKPPPSPYGRMTPVFLTSLPSANHPEPADEGVRQVEAKVPASLFKQQLATYVERIYGILGDNLKKELSSFLSLCSQARRREEGVPRSSLVEDY